jgi:aspartate kinase
MIVAETAGMESIVVRGVTLKKDLARIVLVGVPNKPGVAAQIFARIAEHNIVVDDIIQNVFDKGNEANIGFTTSLADSREAHMVCEKLAKEMKLKAVETDDKIAKVSIVGIGMKTHTGVASRMFNALGKAKINIQNISTSEIVVSCLVDQKDGEKALQILHEAFELGKGGK